MEENHPSEYDSKLNDNIDTKNFLGTEEDLDQISRVALLIDDLSNDDPNAKLHSIQQLEVISKLLGPERCIEELIPLLTELIDKIDSSSEIMMNLAE